MIAPPERIREFLRYDSETGLFERRVQVRNHVAGKAVGAHEHQGYVRVHFEGRLYLAHRLAWFFAHGVWPVEQVDHINCIRSDNRLANLRLATPEQNSRNVTVRRDGLKGVARHKGRSRWLASIKSKGKTYYLGSFDTEDQAHQAYCEAARKLHGSFARLA